MSRLTLQEFNETYRGIAQLMQGDKKLAVEYAEIFYLKAKVLPSQIQTQDCKVSNKQQNSLKLEAVICWLYVLYGSDLGAAWERFNTMQSQNSIAKAKDNLATAADMSQSSSPQLSQSLHSSQAQASPQAQPIRNTIHTLLTQTNKRPDTRRAALSLV